MIIMNHSLWDRVDKIKDIRTTWGEAKNNREMEKEVWLQNDDASMIPVMGRACWLILHGEDILH